MNTGEKMRKNFSDVIAAIKTNMNERADNMITRHLKLKKNYAVAMLIILRILRIFSPYILVDLVLNLINNYNALC